MAVGDFELNLQTEIVCSKCSPNADCLVEFSYEPRHMQLVMGGLEWSIQALPLQSPSEYSFNITEVKRSEPPLSAAPNLPAKFELLLDVYKASMQSVRRADEALDKLYAFSRLFSLAEQDSRWWIVLDAEITATACKCAKEALYQAAQVAAAILVEQVESPVSIGGRQGESCEISGWWIDNWTVADEFWANSFFAPDRWKCMMRPFQAEAVERGNVVQWCSVQVFDEPNPNFQFEVAVHEFLDGDDVLLRIGVANDRALTVRVLLNEAVKVVCSQEGVETRTSLGLAYLLPNVVKDYITSALRQNDAELSSKNVVQGLLRHLISYLACLGKICAICRSERLSDVPRSSTCSADICKATKQEFAVCLPDLMISEEARAIRRNQYVKKLYRNSIEGRRGLGILLNTDVVEEAKTVKHTNDGAINYEEAAKRVATMKSRSRGLGILLNTNVVDEATTSTHANDCAINYEEAVKKVAKMNWRSVARALHIQISDLWIEDDESSDRS